MSLISFFYILTTAALISTILVPFVARLSVHIGVLDTPDERKVHLQATPRLGGIAIFCSLLFTIIFFCNIDKQLKGILAGAIIIFLTGLADDLANLSARQKFVGEFMAAGLVVLMGDVCVRNLGNPFGLGTLVLGPLAVPFTVVGIVGLINAINLLDGLDGLAGGVCTIACVTFAIISFISGNTTLFVLNIAMLGSLLGFLRYNHHPAIIFMGDGGSLLLGYFMGVFSILVATDGSHPVSPYIPLLVLGVPILDTLVVMVNRKLSGKRLFLPDKSHLHHRLLNLGIGHRHTVLIVFGMSYLLSIIAIVGLKLNDGSLLAILLTGAALTYGGLSYLTTGNRRSLLDFSSNGSAYSPGRLRSIVHQTAFFSLGIKYLLLAVLLLPVLLSSTEVCSLSPVPLLLLICSVGIFLSRCTWKNQLLQSHIYISGAFMVLVLENYGRDDYLFGLQLNMVSNIIFGLLLVLALIKILVRKRASRMIVSPFEYLIMLIVLTAPLLPQEFTGKYHLLTVAAKSVIMFVGFKLVLTRQVQRNRRVMLAISLSCLILVIRYLLCLTF